MIREIVIWPDPVLKQVARPVDRVDDGIRRLLDDMAETMYAAPGIGLAATQVDVHKQVIVIDTSETRDALLVLVNPYILAREGSQFCEEGCLSVPGVYEAVERAEWIHVRAMGLDGKPVEFESEKLQAVCIQHEMDHLDGTLFVDRLRGLQKDLIVRRIKKMSRAGKW